MQTINALFLTPDVTDWLANSRHPHILHVFDRACNLINERGEILSIVARQIGNGPFSLVVEDDVLFPTISISNLQSLFSISANRLIPGSLTINIANAKVWSPQPNWEILHAHRDPILNQLTQLPMINDQPLLPTSLLSLQPLPPLIFHLPSLPPKS